MSEIAFLNIDLDIESTEDISSIVSEWGERVSIHRHEEIDGMFYGSFETCCSGIEEIIEEYVSLINQLSPNARSVWNRALKRDFDFGYESGLKPNNFHSRVSEASVKKLADVGGSVVVTIYPAQNT